MISIANIAETTRTHHGYQRRRLPHSARRLESFWYFFFSKKTSSRAIAYSQNGALVNETLPGTIILERQLATRFSEYNKKQRATFEIVLV